MARKTNRQSREQQYRDILMDNGIRFDDCKVLAFVFDDIFGLMHYHYELMFDSSRYHLFDHIGSTAYVIIPKDDKTEQMCVQLAEYCGGKKDSPGFAVRFTQNPARTNPGGVVKIPSWAIRWKLTSQI